MLDPVEIGTALTGRRWNGTPLLTLEEEGGTEGFVEEEGKEEAADGSAAEGLPAPLPCTLMLLLLLFCHLDLSG